MESRDSYVDIGANIGIHSIKLGAHFKRRICFEPNPDVADILSINLKRHKLPAKIERVALGSKTGEALFYENNDGNIGNSTLNNFIVEDKNWVNFSTMMVPIRVPDDVLSNEPVSFIKIDVEGHEVDVIKGLKRTLEVSRPVLMMEITASSQRIFSPQVYLPPKYRTFLIRSNVNEMTAMRKRLRFLLEGGERWGLVEHNGDITTGEPAVFFVPDEIIK